MPDSMKSQSQPVLFQSTLWPGRGYFILVEVNPTNGYLVRALKIPSDSTIGSLMMAASLGYSTACFLSFVGFDGEVSEEVQYDLGEEIHLNFVRSQDGQPGYTAQVVTGRLR